VSLSKGRGGLVAYLRHCGSGNSSGGSGGGANCARREGWLHAFWQAWW
jgi:hypothetical protein